MPLANCYMRVIYSYLFPLFAAITFGIATPIAFISMYWTKHRLYVVKLCTSCYALLVDYYRYILATNGVTN
ncbi:hypothetical protein PF005_g28102 [Phytophthora fragariae]|uniref:Uncharacterized protein n=1 Tax=Phytophthora fragariae TaxID=53985 RepID=A0A6A3VKY1_9STRA|nr:hypothetical protein PF009_g28607 [Phytophthora fragariae]KAE9067427.1 hypothetical protein PF007_g28074 [Phytophthora fragariae]KAE9076750.1 hypothetical protein PF006_g28063 [Phytophthora fragariae]KAE9169101.1 hypothetical protein PF005_g28102 [Phytophthora fragariae]KAE9175915.1 hypothetical protein PF002_g28666 [Phytophthora fragariae]